MDGNLVIEKLVELSALDLKDTQVRRLFIVTNGKRTLDELYKLCKFDKKLGDKVLQVLLDGQYANFTGSQTSSPPQLDDDGNSFVFTAGFIEKLTKEMADYVGPIASILVESAVSLGQSSTSDEFHQILISLSDSLESRDDKKQFLMKMKRHLP